MTAPRCPACGAEEANAQAASCPYPTWSGTERDVQVPSGWSPGGDPPPARHYAKPTRQELARRFLNHTLNKDQERRCSTIRSTCLAVADLIVELTPLGPEQARVVDKIHEAMLLACAGIAYHEGDV